MKLKDLAMVTTGQILSRVTDDNDTSGDRIPVLSPTAVDNGFIHQADLKETYLIKSVDRDKFTQEGDVVLKLSSPYDAAYIDYDNRLSLIPNFLAVLRIKEDIDPYFLVAFLNSTYFRNKMESIQTGARRPMIRVSDLREIEVPDIPHERMKALGEQYRLSCEKRALLSEMAKVEEEVMENTLLEAIKEAKDGGN